MYCIAVPRSIPSLPDIPRSENVVLSFTLRTFFLQLSYPASLTRLHPSTHCFFLPHAHNRTSGGSNHDQKSERRLQSSIGEGKESRRSVQNQSRCGKAPSS